MDKFSEDVLDGVTYDWQVLSPSTFLAGVLADALNARYTQWQFEPEGLSVIARRRSQCNECGAYSYHRPVGSRLGGQKA